MRCGAGHPVAFHRVAQPRRENGPHRADRVAMGNRAAIDIDDVERKAQLLCHSKRHGGEGILAPDPQTRLTVSTGTVTGSPAPMAACRAGFIRFPACMTLPMITLSILSDARPARRGVSPVAMAPSSVRTGWTRMICGVDMGGFSAVIRRWA